MRKRYKTSTQIEYSQINWIKNNCKFLNNNNNSNKSEMLTLMKMMMGMARNSQIIKNNKNNLMDKIELIKTSRLITIKIRVNKIYKMLILY